MAETEGFEPPVVLPTPEFESGTISLSDTSPKLSVRFDALLFLSMSCTSDVMGWRRRRDLNPRWCDPHPISNRAP